MIMFVAFMLVVGLLVTVGVYLVGAFSTKEVTFEEAQARLRALNKLENPQQATAKKAKTATKAKTGGRSVRTARKKADHSPATQTSGTSSDEDDAMIQEQRQVDDFEKQAKKDRQAKKEELKKEQEAKREQEARKEQEQAAKKEQQEKKKQQEQAAKKEQQDKKRQQENAEQKKKEVKKEKVEVVKAEPEDAKKPRKQKKSETEQKPEVLEAFEDMLVDSVVKKAAKATQAAPQATAVSKKTVVKQERATVRSVLEFIEKNQLSADQISALVDSLLAIASEGGWSEAGKTADSATARKLEEALANVSAMQVAKSGLMTKISGLRGELNNEKIKVAQLKVQKEEGTDKLAKAVESERISVEQQRSSLTSQFSLTLAAERAEWSAKLLAAGSAGVEEARLQLCTQQQEAQAQLCAAQATCQELQSQLASAEQRSTDMSAQLLDMSTQLQQAQAATQQLHMQASQCAQDKSDSEARLSSSLHNLQSEHDQLQMSLHAAPTQEQLDQGNARLQESQSALDTERAAVARLTDEVAAVRHQMTEEAQAAATRLAAAGAKHDELRTKNTTLLGALKQTESRLQDKMQTATDDVASCDNLYRDMLRRLYPTVQVDAKDCSAFMQQFESAAAAVAADQAAAAEEAVVEVLEKVVECPEQAKLVQALTAQVEALTAQVSTLQTQLKEAAATPAPAAVDTNTDTLKAENATLTEETARYRRVLDETEASLRTLEASVTAEELKWAAKAAEQDAVILAKEACITQLQAQQSSLSEVTAQNEALELQLEKLKQEKAACSTNGAADDSKQ